MNDRYSTVAEVTDSARKLVSRFPGTARLRRIGTSREGRPLLMLSAGHGPHDALVVAGPHPDERAAGGTALALAELAARGDRQSPATDPSLVTWNIVLCLDPDGAALAEAGADAGLVLGRGFDPVSVPGLGNGAGPGFGPGLGPTSAKRPASLASYYRTAYRPMAAEQPEWAPVAAHPIPETLALLRVIDELRPFVQCSLHSTDVGGSWIQLTRDLPDLAVPFRESADALGIPLQQGTYDALYWENPSPAIYVLPAGDSAARLAAGSEDIARSTWCAPQHYGGVTAIIEVPIWATPMVADTTPEPEAVRLLSDLADLVRDGGRQVTAVLDKARGFLPPPETDPLRRVLEWMAAGLYDLVATSWQPLAQQVAAANTPEDPRHLTTAQVTALDIVARRQPLRAAGLLLRLLEASANTAAPALHDELSDLFTTWSADFETALRTHPVPVGAQVAHQTRTAVAAAECALKALGQG
ncbi:M14 family zinc carboxypeptidase [Streptomyces sp. NPDC092129]|uniref:M14 family zinc carboxypeptidase n=1 Tax=Streptomyces sp. NPDC092129 TaxID=3366010 RepID=UPI00382558B0